MTPSQGTNEFRAASHNKRLYYWGSIWPNGRDHARDEAQIRILKHELAAMPAENNTQKGNAA